MDKRIYIANLFDYYFSLLTEKQKIIFEMYYINDFSFSEIGEILLITKQGVRDSIIKTENILQDFEEKLELCKKHNKKCEYIDEIISSYNINENLKNSIESLKFI